MRKIKLVLIGGGTGLSVLARGLRDYQIDITTIVTVVMMVVVQVRLEMKWIYLRLEIFEM